MAASVKYHALTVGQRFWTTEENTQRVRSGSPHCPSLPHGLEARLDCDASHTHGWVAVWPTSVWGHIIDSTVSGGQEGPVDRVIRCEVVINIKHIQIHMYIIPYNLHHPKCTQHLHTLAPHHSYCTCMHCPLTIVVQDDHLSHVWGAWQNSKFLSSLGGVEGDGKILH